MRKEKVYIFKIYFQIAMFMKKGVYIYNIQLQALQFDIIDDIYTPFHNKGVEKINHRDNSSKTTISASK